MILDFVQPKAWWWGGAIAPIMGWLGTTTVTSITDTTATLTWEWLSDWGSSITATWFTLYLSWNPTYTIWSPWVTDIPDISLPSPITANASSLLPWTNYCIRPYATNSVWTSYWVQVCFTTASFLYVTNSNASWTVSKINTSTNTIWTTIGVWNSPQVIKKNWTFAYVLNTNWSSVSKIDLATDTVSATITVWVVPQDIVFQWIYAYVSNRASWTVSKINTSTNTVVATISGVGAASWLTINGTLLYATQNNALWDITIIDLTTDTVIGNITWVWTFTYRIVNDWTYLYFTRATSPWQVVKVNIATSTVVWTVTTWNNSQGIAMDWGLLYVLARNGNLLEKIDPVTMTVLGSISVTNPTSIQIVSWFAYVVENWWSLRKISVPGLTLSTSYTMAAWWYGVMVP